MNLSLSLLLETGQGNCTLKGIANLSPVPNRANLGPWLTLAVKERFSIAENIIAVDINKIALDQLV